MTSDVEQHLAALTAWRALSRQEQGNRLSAAMPGREPEPAGNRLKVGLWAPCLWHGGAEVWQETLSRSVDRSRIAWQGCAVVGTTLIEPDVRATLEAEMPIGVGIESARDLASRCDLVVSWSGIAPDRILADLPRKPQILYVCHLPPAGYVGGFPDLPGVDHYVAVSPAARESIPELQRQSCRVIDNAVDESRLIVGRDRATMHRLWNLPPGSRVAGSIGRLERDKDPLAMRRLAACLSNPWQVVMIGDGSLRASLLATRPGNLHLAGTDSAIGDVLNGFDVLVNPSWYESFGLTIAEGLAAGVPVVSTRVGFLQTTRTELVRQVLIYSDGETLASTVLIDAADHRGTAERIARGKRYVAERFSLTRFGQEWTDYLCSLAIPRVNPHIARLTRAKACPHRGPVSVDSGPCDCLVVCLIGRGRPVPGTDVTSVSINDCLSCPMTAE